MTDITRDAEHDARHSRRRRSPRRYRSRGRRRCSLVSPQLATSATMRGVPRAARGGERAGDVVGQDPGQDHLPPPLARRAGGTGSTASRRSVGKAAGAGDHVEQDVPLRAQHHQRAAARCSGSRCQWHDRHHGDREQHVGREGGEELRHRLHRAAAQRAAARSTRRPAPRSTLASAISTTTRTRVSRPSSTAISDVVPVERRGDVNSTIRHSA